MKTTPMKTLSVLLVLFTVSFATAADKKALQLASVGFAPSAEKLLPAVEIPTQEEVTETCNTAYKSCLRGGASFRSQCDVLRRDCLTPGE